MTHAIFLTEPSVFILILSDSKWIYLTGMTLMGFAWGSIVAIPYLMIADAVSPGAHGRVHGIDQWIYLCASVYRDVDCAFLYKTFLGMIHAMPCFYVVPAFCWRR
ncbi:MAG: hypothetical protein IPP42_01310 [Saprospiraceae bacterium]|nr:hypothetical protein [Saprospiraceae bacterium]